MYSMHSGGKINNRMLHNRSYCLPFCLCVSITYNQPIITMTMTIKTIHSSHQIMDMIIPKYCPNTIDLIVYLSACVRPAKTQSQPMMIMMMTMTKTIHHELSVSAASGYDYL